MKTVIDGVEAHFIGRKEKTIQVRNLVHSLLELKRGFAYGLLGLSLIHILNEYTRLKWKHVYTIRMLLNNK